MYLTRREETQLFGTELCRLQTEQDAPSHCPYDVEDAEREVVRKVPWLPNTAVIFLNSTGVHRASIPADAPADVDRYIYQLQLGPAKDSPPRPSSPQRASHVGARHLPWSKCVQLTAPAEITVLA